MLRGLKKICILLLLIVTIASCQTCPSEPEKLKEYMVVDPVPRMVVLETSILTDEFIQMWLERDVVVYSAFQKLYMTLKETEYVIPENLNKQLSYCVEALIWLGSLEETGEGTIGQAD